MKKMKKIEKKESFWIWGQKRGFLVKKACENPRSGIENLRKFQKSELKTAVPGTRNP
jgi:hypothetical protein